METNWRKVELLIFDILNNHEISGHDACLQVSGLVYEYFYIKHPGWQHIICIGNAIFLDKTTGRSEKYASDNPHPSYHAWNVEILPDKTVLLFDFSVGKIFQTTLPKTTYIGLKEHPLVLKLKAMEFSIEDDKKLTFFPFEKETDYSMVKYSPIGIIGIDISIPLNIQNELNVLCDELDRRLNAY